MSTAADTPPPDTEPDVEAWEKQIENLYNDCHRPVLRKATMAAAGNTQDAWDGTQHAFFQAWKHLCRAGAPPIANWQGWLIKTAVRHVLFSRRRDGTCVPLEDADHADDQILLEDHVVLKETYQGIMDAIGELSEHQRQALVLVHIAGCSTAEAAEDMNVSTSTVRNLIHQARIRLADGNGEASDD